jgi:hypothetical protein
MGTSLGGVGSQGTAQGATDPSSSQQIFTVPGGNVPITDILGSGMIRKLLSPKSQAEFMSAAETAFRHCQTNLLPGACFDLGTDGAFSAPGMYLRALDQSAYIVQSLGDATNLTQNGLQIRKTQGGYAVSYDGRPVDWQSPEAKPVYSVMKRLAKILQSDPRRMVVPLPTANAASTQGLLPGDFGEAMMQSQRSEAEAGWTGGNLYGKHGIISGVAGGTPSRGPTRSTNNTPPSPHELPTQSVVDLPTTYIPGYGSKHYLFLTRSQNSFEGITRMALQSCQRHLVSGACHDLGMLYRYPLPEFYLREGEPGEYFVQRWPDIENRSQRGLRLYGRQGHYTVSYDGRLLDWLSPEANQAYPVMFSLANALDWGKPEMTVALPMAE